MRLEWPGWSPKALRDLDTLIRTHAGQGQAAVFDFDNTLVCGDIGEATLAVLVRDRQVVPGRLPPALLAEFRLPGKDLARVRDCADLTEYYEHLLTPGAHGPNDPTPMANGYVWAAEVLQGLTVRDVVQATETAFAAAQPGEVRRIEVTPGRTAYPAPFFLPQMVELLAMLIDHGFDVWIVSASNVWSVRWMVRYGLNPLLQRQGVGVGLAPDRVVGVSLLMSDPRGQLLKDRLLVQRDRAYAALEGDRLAQLRLTGRLEFPVPAYSGKVACIWDHLGRPPLLAAGDSPGDHAMLRFSAHRLWMARLDKPDYQQATARLLALTGRNSWIIQPVLGKEQPGFLPTLESLDLVSPALAATARKAWGYLASRGSRRA